MNATKDDLIAMAASARTPEEIERAIVALAALPDDPDVDAARTALSRALDQATRRPGGLSRHGDRVTDQALNPGFDNN
jgi:hypothetical protein